MIRVIERTFEKQLGEDILHLIFKQDKPLVDITSLTTLGSAHSLRGSFLVEFGDGTKVKVRRLADQRQVQEMVHYANFLESSQFPKVLDHHGNAILMEWMKGRRMNLDDINLAFVVQAGELLAKIHQTPVLTELYDPVAKDFSYWQKSLREKLNGLIEQGILLREEAGEIFAKAQIRNFDQLKIGIIHGDYSMDNLIMDDFAKIKVVDLETVNLAPFDYDLARSVYRWPLSKVLRRPFFKSYEETMSTETFFENFSFWIIYVLVESIKFRSDSLIKDYRIPLQQLRDVMACKTQKGIKNIFGF